MLSLLRIVAGGIFVTSGTMKVFGWPPGPPEVPPFDPLTQIGIGGLLEVFGGLCITVGLLTRPVAFVLSGMMAVAYWQFHAPASVHPIVNGGIPAILYCFLFLYLVFAGAGSWSVDAWIARRSGGQQGPGMIGTSFLLALLLAAGGCASGGRVSPGGTMSRLDSQPIESGHAPVHGIRMYYEVHGRADGVPLVLLHGGGSTIEVTFGRLLPFLARSRRVIAVEEQGHGRTTDRDGPVTFEGSADDVAALLAHLGVDEADLFGFSNGASVALQVAIRHPAKVRKLVFASSITQRDGARPELWEWIEQADFSNMPQPLKDAFLRVNPDERQLRTMHDKDAARMRSFEDVPDDLLRSVQAPTLIVLGDQDIVEPEHALELTRLLPDARLLILPGGHGDYLGEAVMTQRESAYPELTAGLIEEFLNSQ
jgi:pimeloyl-ACP methyl ester carboxylesterase/uncharacterized membrane protein YphA (DoxX/SURF4 family)